MPSPYANGEYWLLERLMAATSSKAPIFLDIGANKGDWSEQAASLLKRHNISGHVYAFEPTASTFAYLSEKFKGSERVSTSRIALSDQSGEREFFVVGELAGINSLLRIDGATTESVTTLRLDDFLAKERIDHVLFVKSDTEGHDLSVLMGATEALRQGRVDVWQFEYNHRWIGERSVLKDVFDFMEDKPYRVGKLYGNGVEVFEQWHPELERFFESNYTLIRKGSGFENLCTPVHFDTRNVLVPS